MTDPEGTSEGTGKAAGPRGEPQLARVQRGLRNLAYELEQRHRAVESELSEIREQVHAVERSPVGARPSDDNGQSAAGPGDGRSDELTLVKRQVEALELAVVEPRNGGQGSSGAAEIRALRRQVAELQRSVAEVRRMELARAARRRRLAAVPAAPLALLRRARSRLAATAVKSNRPPHPGQARQSPARARMKRAARRTARLLRRARMRTRRLARKSRAWLRDHLLGRRLGLLSHHPPKPIHVPRRYAQVIELADPPVISIVTPSYNHGRFIERTIKSVVEQGYPQLEYMVQDGGSTDETKDVLARHADHLHHYEMRKDNGQSDAINLGFRHASGDVMAYLNSDDLLMPGSLRYVAGYFAEHPDVDLVYGHRVLVDEQDMEIGRWVMPRHDPEVLSWADYVPQETMFWRRSLWERAGGQIDPSWMFAMDWDLLLRFRDADAKVVRLPRFLGAFRIHEAQKTAVIDSEGMSEMDALRRRSLGRDVTRQEITKSLRPYMWRHHLLQKLYRARLVRY